MVTLVYAITVASFAVVLGTWLRLGRSGSGWLRLHTVFGIAGFVVWSAFLVAPPSSTLGGALVGVIGLGCWWIVALVGLVLIPSARPGGGRRVARSRRAGGAWVAAIVHVGVLLAWVLATWAYATAKV